MAEEYTKDELAQWFESKAAATASGQVARNKIFGASDRAGSRTFAGKLYVFSYIPKHRETLEMWDKYPLCMVLEKQLGSFLGLNLHYLPRPQRLTLLEGFNKYAHEYEIETGTNTGEGVSNWELLVKSMNTSGMGAMPKKCLKRYLMPYVRSKFVEIYPDEFDRAIQLPIDLWSFKR